MLSASCVKLRLIALLCSIIMLTGCMSNVNQQSSSISNQTQITSVTTPERSPIDTTTTLSLEDELNYTTARTYTATAEKATTTEPIVVESGVDEETLYRQQILD